MKALKDPERAFSGLGFEGLGFRVLRAAGHVVTLQ